jgi:hypothetical protein
MKLPVSYMPGRQAVLIALSVLALCVALAACGGSSGSGTAGTTSAGDPGTSSSARYDARLNLAKCLRSHGINVPDPTVGGGVPDGAFRILRDYPQSQIQAAMQACRPYLTQAFPRLNLSPAQRAQFQQQAVKFAECMRSHGINIPDPTFNGNGGFGFRQALGSIDRNSPAFQSALQACQSLRPHFGRGGGIVVGGGGGRGTAASGGGIRG